MNVSTRQYVRDKKPISTRKYGKFQPRKPRGFLEFSEWKGNPCLDGNNRILQSPFKTPPARLPWRYDEVIATNIFRGKKSRTARRSRPREKGGGGGGGGERYAWALHKATVLCQILCKEVDARISSGRTWYRVGKTISRPSRHHEWI